MNDNTINYSDFIQKELDILEYKNATIYTKDEIYRRLNTCQDLKTCMKYAEMLGWSYQRTSHFLHRHFPNGFSKQTDYSDQITDNTAEKKDITPLCEYGTVLNWSKIIALTGLALIARSLFLFVIWRLLSL